MINLITKFNKYYGCHDEDSLFIKKLKDKFNDKFNDIQIESILNILENICTNCYNNEKPCYCMCDN